MAHRQLEQAINQTESLRLPLNKVYLYREAATGLTATDKGEASQLLQRALADLDIAKANVSEQRKPDLQMLARLDFARRPVILQLAHINPTLGLQALDAPQSADRDTEFQRMVFEQVVAQNPDAVRAAAERKLGYGVTPAAVAAYAVLQQRDPDMARVLATEIVSRLATQDPAKNPAAVQAAFGLLRLLRTDEGTRAAKIVLNPDLLDDASVHTLFDFIGDAFLAAKQPELLIVPEAPKLYIAALEEYAPGRADKVEQLPFAQPDAKSLIFSAQPLTADAPDGAGPPPVPTPEQQKQQAQAQTQLRAQVAKTAMDMVPLDAEAVDPGLNAAAAQKAVEQALGEVNDTLALGRSLTPSLQPEAFQEGEFELYGDGPLTGIIDSATSLLCSFARAHPSAAFAAIDQLDGTAVQTGVALELAVHLQEAAQKAGSAALATRR